jgi:hypothetical protein
MGELKLFPYYVARSRHSWYMRWVDEGGVEHTHRIETGVASFIGGRDAAERYAAAFYQEWERQSEPPKLPPSMREGDSVSQVVLNEEKVMRKMEKKVLPLVEATKPLELDVNRNDIR